MNIQEFKKNFQENVRSDKFTTFNPDGKLDGLNLEFSNVVIAWFEDEADKEKSLSEHNVKGFGKAVVVSTYLSDDLKKQATRETADRLYDEFVEEHGTSALFAHLFVGQRETIYE